MGRRPSLAESMRQVAVTANEQAPVTVPALTIVTPPPAPETPAGVPVAKPYFAATRTGKKKVTLGLSPAAHKQLKGLALEHDTKTESLMAEAVRDLFAKYGKPQID